MKSSTAQILKTWIFFLLMLVGLSPYNIENVTRLNEISPRLYYDILMFFNEVSQKMKSHQWKIHNIKVNPVFWVFSVTVLILCMYNCWTFEIWTRPIEAGNQLCMIRKYLLFIVHLEFVVIIQICEINMIFILIYIMHANVSLLLDSNAGFSSLQNHVCSSSLSN